MKTIQELIEEAKAEGVADEDMRKHLTEVMRNKLRVKMQVKGAPNPAIMAGVGQEHLGALFAYIIEMIMVTAKEEDVEMAINDFQAFREFDITARQYSVFILEDQNEKI